jgi:hypothetical protein
MSVPYQWPIAFMKQWIQPIAYIVGFDYNYNIVPILNQSTSSNFLGGVINFSVLFSYPVMSVYAFSYVEGYPTYPITIFLDYPTYSLFMQINISP